MFNFFNFKNIQHVLKRTKRCLIYRLKKSKIYINLNPFFITFKTYFISCIKYSVKPIKRGLFITFVVVSLKYRIVELMYHYNVPYSYICAVNNCWDQFTSLLEWLIFNIYKILIDSCYFIYKNIIDFCMILLLLIKILLIYIKLMLIYIKNYFIEYILIPIFKPIFTFFMELVISLWKDNTREVLDSWFNFSEYELTILIYLNNPINRLTYDMNALFCIILSWFWIELAERHFSKKIFVRVVHGLLGITLFYLNLWVLINTRHSEFIIILLLLLLAKCWLTSWRFHAYFEEYRICLGTGDILFLFSFLNLKINIFRYAYVKYILQRQRYNIIADDMNDPIQLAFFRYLYCSNYARIVLVLLLLILYILIIRFYMKNRIASYLNVFYIYDMLKIKYLSFCTYISKKKNKLFFKIRLFFLCESETDFDNSYLPTVVDKKKK